MKTYKIETNTDLVRMIDKIGEMQHDLELLGAAGGGAVTGEPLPSAISAQGFGANTGWVRTKYWLGSGKTLVGFMRNTGWVALDPTGTLWRGCRGYGVGVGCRCTVDFTAVNDLVGTGLDQVTGFKFKWTSPGETPEPMELATTPRGQTTEIVAVGVPAVA